MKNQNKYACKLEHCFDIYSLDQNFHKTVFKNSFHNQFTVMQWSITWSRAVCASIQLNILNVV